MGWFGDIDALLRGRKSDPEILAAGTGHLGVRRHITHVIVLGAIYGLAMGLYAAITRDPGTPEQLISAAAKVPLLFLLSLVVTLPSFLVFSALLGVRLSPREAVRVIVAGILVTVAVLASFAPITAFFTVCTTSYPFLKLLNLLFFIVAGAIGIGFFRRLVGVLERVRAPSPEEEPPAEPPPPLPVDPGAPPPSAARAAPPPVRRPTPDERLTSRRLMRVWVVIYVLVACQMAWLIRPLVGLPDEPFVWFKFDERGGSFLLDLARTFRDLFGV